jgi:hypothetical protein
MKTNLLKTMQQWIAEHIETVIVLILAGVGQLASYLNLRRDVKDHAGRLEKAETDLDKHVSSPALHRNPDFETGLTEIKAELRRIDNKLDQALRLQPRRS